MSLPDIYDTPLPIRYFLCKVEGNEDPCLLHVAGDESDLHRVYNQHLITIIEAREITREEAEG